MVCSCDCRHLMRFIAIAAGQPPGFTVVPQRWKVTELSPQSDHALQYVLGSEDTAYFRTVVATHPFTDTLQYMYSKDEILALWRTLEQCRCCERHQRSRPALTAGPPPALQP